LFRFATATTCIMESHNNFDSIALAWEFVKSAAAMSRDHKARVASRDQALAALLSRKAAKHAAKKAKHAAASEHGAAHGWKRFRSGKGSKGRNIFADTGRDDHDDEWHEDGYLDDGHEVGEGFAFRPFRPPDVPAESIRNAWTLFGQVSQTASLPSHQESSSKSCAICCERGIPLFTNLGCGDVACSPCLRWWVAQFPQSRGDSFLNRRGFVDPSKPIPCFMPGCQNTGCQNTLAIPARLPQRSPSHRERTPSDTTCVLCCERRPLLQNVGCSTSACGSCWQRWVSSQLPRCRAERQLGTIPCFDPSCGTAICQSLLRRACATSANGLELICDLAFLRRLQKNPLFPPETHEYCPRPGCLGLGYLGLDRVMCFVCEHQWISVGKGALDSLPNDVKECPNCGVKIDKNGGCDHMTCTQCSCEFWWTTLAPM